MENNFSNSKLVRYSYDNYTIKGFVFYEAFNTKQTARYNYLKETYQIHDKGFEKELSRIVLFKTEEYIDNVLDWLEFIGENTVYAATRNSFLLGFIHYLFHFSKALDFENEQLKAFKKHLKIALSHDFENLKSISVIKLIVNLRLLAKFPEKQKVPLNTVLHKFETGEFYCWESSSNREDSEHQTIYTALFHFERVPYLLSKYFDHCGQRELDLCEGVLQGKDLQTLFNKINLPISQKESALLQELHSLMHITAEGDYILERILLKVRFLSAMDNTYGKNCYYIIEDLTTTISVDYIFKDYQFWVAILLLVYNYDGEIAQNDYGDFMYFLFYSRYVIEFDYEEDTEIQGINTSFSVQGKTIPELIKVAKEYSKPQFEFTSKI